MGMIADVGRHLEGRHLLGGPGSVRDVASPDAVDIRLLALVAELGRVAVHDVAARLGMDPREVASRLVALSGSGFPLLVGVECDQKRLRAELARAGPWPNYAAHGAPGAPPASQVPLPSPSPKGPNSSHAMPRSPASTHQNPPHQAPQHQVPQYHGTGYQGPPSVPFPAAGSAPVPAPATPPAPVTPLAPVTPSASATPSAPATSVSPVSTWGPPQSAAWTRGDQPPRPASSQPSLRATATAAPTDGSGPHPPPGRLGDTLRAKGADGEQLTIQLVDVVDPADLLFSAAGYRLRAGERAVVVHTELTNRGSAPMSTLPDLYLVLVAKDGQAIAKAPVTLSSRPPHRIGLPAGETAGGHTVYVLPEDIEITAVRWSASPDDDANAITWLIEP